MSPYLVKKCAAFGSLRLLPGLAGLVLLASSALAGSSPPPPAQATDPASCRSEAGPPLAPALEEALAALEAQVPAQVLWQPSWRLQVLLAELHALQFDGLDPAHYGLAALTALQQRQAAGEALDACAARQASRAYLQALHDLHFGRLDPERLGLVWYAPGSRRDHGVQALHALALHQLGDPAATFAAARLRLPRYRQLRQAYREALATLPADWPEVPAGRLLRRGDSDPRLVVLRQRLRRQGYLPALPDGQVDSPHFGTTLADALAAFQADHGLAADGKLGADTLAALNRPPTQWLDTLRVNLERMRWLAQDLEPDSVLVDIAGAQVEYFVQGQVAWSGRAQVGKATRSTPALKSAINSLTLNPHWTVPPTIFREDMLPGIAGNPQYLQQQRIRAYDAQGTELALDSIDWRAPGNVMLRQEAGPGNALGRVVLRFPNPFWVYLHDTPKIGLFEAPTRFYSSGCVRVAGILQLAELLFANSSEPLPPDLPALIDSGETLNIRLPEGIALLMAYWTAEADANGRVRYRPDTYQRDALLLALLEQAQPPTALPLAATPAPASP